MSAPKKRRTLALDQFKCCAPGCETRKIVNMSLHPFPNQSVEPERHDIWKQLLLIEGNVKPTDLVCTTHFPEASFKVNEDGRRTIFLRADAYPYATSKLRLRQERRLALQKQQRIQAVESFRTANSAQLNNIARATAAVVATAEASQEEPEPIEYIELDS